MILVTGGNGFVGSALVRTLSTFGSENVRATFRDSSDIPAGFKGGVTVKSIDAETDWSDILRGVNVVVHTAARVHVMRESAADPAADYHRINVEGTLNLARQSATAGVKRFVFLSSIKVNGEKTLPGHPFTADDSPKPEGSYAVSKLEAERALLKLGAQTGLEVVIIRPVLVYGPGVKGNFQTLVRILEKGIPLPLASLRNRRSLVGLSNLVDLIAACIGHANAANQIFLASDGEDLSTPELLRRTARALERPARLLPFPETVLRVVARLTGQVDAVSRLADSLQVDISKNREMLGWVPRTTVDEELRMLAEARRISNRAFRPS